MIFFLFFFCVYASIHPKIFLVKRMANKRTTVIIDGVNYSWFEGVSSNSILNSITTPASFTMHNTSTGEVVTTSDLHTITSGTCWRSAPHAQTRARAHEHEKEEEDDSIVSLDLSSSDITTPLLLLNFTETPPPPPPPPPPPLIPLVLAHYFDSDGNRALLFQFKTLTHLASERTFLVWQRCSLTLVSAAFTCLKISMAHERSPIVIDIDDDLPWIDDSFGNARNGNGNGNRNSTLKKKYGDTDDIIDYEVDRFYYLGLGAGATLFFVVNLLSFLGPLQFRRTKRWLKEDSVQMCEAFGSLESNLLGVIFGFTVVSAITIFGMLTIWLNRDDSFSPFDDDVIPERRLVV